MNSTHLIMRVDVALKVVKKNFLKTDYISPVPSIEDMILSESVKQQQSAHH